MRSAVVGVHVVKMYTGKDGASHAIAANAHATLIAVEVSDVATTHGSKSIARWLIILANAMP